MKVLRLRLRKSIAISVGVVAILVFSIVTHQHSASASSQRAHVVQRDAPIHEHFAGWEYMAASTNEALEIIVNYEKLTPEGIKAFAEANRKLIDQIHGQVSVSVVFRRPLSINEFQALVGKSGLSVESYTMRAVDSAGQRITIQGAPDTKALVPQAMFNSMLTNIQSRSAGVSFRGIVTVNGIATPEQIKQLLADKRVFTTDVTQAIAAERARAQLASQNTALAQLPVHARLAAPLYWFMENTGIAAK